LAANFRQLRGLRRGKRRLGACVAYFIGPFAATQRCVDLMITDTSDCVAYFIGPFAATQRCVDLMITDTSDCLSCLQVLQT
jgi:hypothetical protein